MTHGHDIDGMLAGDGVSARGLRLHLDNSHDERTTGWDFGRLHALHQEMHAAQMSGVVLASLGTAGGAGASLGAAPSAAPFEHVWTCGLKAGEDTCECEAYARS
jgi:hypothetical protein